jgi:hypothetical protein
MSPARLSEATRQTIDTALTLLGKVPTTQARILVTLLLGFGTAVRYWLATPGGWAPSWEWLGFLSVWAGIDAAQFYSKRATHIPPAAETPGAPEATP